MRPEKYLNPQGCSDGVGFCQLLPPSTISHDTGLTGLANQTHWVHEDPVPSQPHLPSEVLVLGHQRQFLMILVQTIAVVKVLGCPLPLRSYTVFQLLLSTGRAVTVFSVPVYLIYSRIPHF